MAMAEPINPEQKRDWILKSDGTIVCFASTNSKCKIQRLWELENLTPFHDAELAKCTREINRLLAEVVERDQDPRRRLGFITIGNSQLLVWLECSAIGSADKPDTLVQAMGLRT